jgi:hypothetical protein
MALILLKVGDAVGFRRPDDWSMVPDDRQEMHQTIDGNVVEDYGHVESGDKITCTAVFAYQEYIKIYNYWTQRTMVDVIDHAGTDWGKMRVIIRKDAYVPRFESYHQLDLEFWRI